MPISPKNRRGFLVNFIRKNRVNIQCPPLFLYQIVINLISNAIDSYNEISDTRKRQINIYLEKDLEYINLQISDNGIGVRKTDADKIFNPFYTTKEKGTGIGLPTVKNILEEKLGGSIKLESDAGSRTVFKILIPLKNQK